jgi:hypothetical protein
VSSQRDQGDSETDAAERRLEVLAEEIERVILGCDAGERDALHGYAVSLVRDRLPVVEVYYDATDGPREDDEDEPRVERTGSAASFIGYGILLVLVGLPLLIVFPFMGILLFVAGAGMCLLGLVLTVFSRSGPSAQRATPGGSK